LSDPETQKEALARPASATTPDRWGMSAAFLWIYSVAFLATLAIKSIHTSKNGLIIRRKSGGAVTAWAIQKSNFVPGRPNHARADDIADAIMARVPPSE
jgi:hypothetical protein